MADLLTSNIEIKIGDTKEWEFAVTSTNNRTGVVSVVNISAGTFRFTAKTNYTDADNAAIITKTSSTGITVVDGAGGIGKLKLSPSDTSGLTNQPAYLHYDLQLALSSETYTIAVGVLKLIEQFAITTP